MPSRRATLAARLVLLTAFAILGAVPRGAAQGAAVTVSGVVTLAAPTPAAPDLSEVVVWLTPMADRPGSRVTPPPGHFKIVQRGKRFLPHVLVVPAGSVVDFPNVDPVFHNVFSLFEGKRFDLGLYEAGGSRSVTFGKAGVSYVFCNIHPEMSAMVVALDTPHFTISAVNGGFTIADVPPGRYRVSVWHDRLKPEHPTEFPREVTISTTSASLGALRFVDPGRATAGHKNKFGHDYTPPDATSPIYR